MKICKNCQIEKPYDDFHKDKSRKDGHYTNCKDCESDRRKSKYREDSAASLESAAKYRKQNKAKIYERRDERRNENQIRVFEYFKDHPCVDCGEEDPIVLDFDHLRDKRQNVSRMKYQAWSTILKEIEKCEVRCANCHRRKTAKQFGYFQYMEG